MSMRQEHGIDDSISTNDQGDLIGSVECFNLAIEYNHLPRATINLTRYDPNLRRFEEVVDQTCTAN
jgi:hypothetical protein